MKTEVVGFPHSGIELHIGVDQSLQCYSECHVFTRHVFIECWKYFPLAPRHASRLKTRLLHVAILQGNRAGVKKLATVVKCNNVPIYFLYCFHRTFSLSIQ